jgi:hypothetical protein
VDKVVFIIGAELSGKSKAWENEGYAGGFVNCVTFAEDIPKALDNCRKALSEDNYEVVIFDSAFIFNESEFDGSEVTLEAVSRLKLESHEVQYGNFHVYGH